MIDFVDLHAHTSYSILDGHPDPDQAIEKAISLGRRAHAITDHGSISGHVLFEKAVAGYKQKTIGANTMFIRDGQALDIKPIYGMEAYATTDVKGTGREFQRKFHISLLAKNAQGYQNLLRLVTRSFEEGFYYRQSIDGPMLMDQSEGLIVLSGCETSSFMKRIEAQDWDGARALARNYHSAFGDDFYVEIQHFPHVSEKAQWAWRIAEELGLKTVLTCDSHYLEPDGWRYQQFLWSIRDGKPVEHDGFKIEYAYLWEPDELFAFVTRNSPEINWQRVFENTVEAAEKCERFQLPRAPHVTFPMEGDKLAHIYWTCQRRLESLGKWTPEYQQRLQRELGVIRDKEYQDYFLVVADMINWAKSQGIFVGPARGSSAGSVTCYGLRITEVDPIEYNLMFERFVDPTRTDLPDIDCDFEDERRGEVFAYMARKYGERCVAFISTFARLQGKSALNDAARSYRIPNADIDIIQRHLVDRSSGDQRAELTITDTLAEFPEAAEVYERYPALKIAAGCEGKIRHTGKHAAGLVVTSEPIDNYCAVYKAGDERLIAVDWRDSQYLNLMKIDCLGLKELTLYRLMCNKLGMTLDDLYNLPFNDPETYAAFNRHDYLGIFQFTGLATKGVASRVHFSDIREIADVNALSRPGPLHAGATESYVTGKSKGNFTPILPQPNVSPIIDPTFGQIIYQEQVMRILRDVGGMTWQDVCDIRNVMGKSKGSEAFDNYYPKWEQNTSERGLSAADAKQIWECIRLYGKHSFNAAHAMSYGFLAYWSMWFKAHHPAHFYWAQLVKAADDNASQRFVGEAMRHDIAFAPISLDMATETWDIDGDGVIHPGWQVIKGIGPKAAEELAKGVAAYGGKPQSIEELAKAVNKRVVHAGVQRIIAENLGKTVAQLYNLDKWEEISKLVPYRKAISLVNDGFVWEPGMTVVGRVNRINKKNRIEEYKTSGRSTEKLTAPSAEYDYVILIIEDETDSCMVYVSPEMYREYKQEIWQCEGTFIAVRGNKLPNIQLISAQGIKFAITGRKERVAPPIHGGKGGTVETGVMN